MSKAQDFLKRNEASERPQADLRDDYYGITDGIQGLMDTAKKLGDKALIKAIQDVEKASDKLHKIMNSTYRWD
jgi:hypothetical protein